MSKIDAFIEIFQLPPAMIPHIEFVITGQEMDLVAGLGNQEMTLGQIAEMMELSLEEAEELVEKAFLREVIARAETSDRALCGLQEATDTTKYKAGRFYRRLDSLAMYENWGDVPVEARKAVVEWQLQEYINTWQTAFDEIRRDPNAKVDVPNRDYILLEEALEMVDAATEHAVVPCDCREIVMACDRPREVCVRFDQGALLTLEHGQGRRVSKEEMKKIVIEANRAGLMHSGKRDWREEDGRVFGFLCHCCACDCYPIRAGLKLGMGHAYPRVYYVAERNMDKCNLCGLCARRCHFDAFYSDGARVEFKGRMRKAVLFDAEKCRGCGICATTCPEGAITMQALHRMTEVRGA